MLTRKQQWRRTRVRRAPRSFDGAAAVADGGNNKPGLERRERDRESTTSTSSTISSWSSSSFDSLQDDDGDDNGCCDELSPAQANRSAKHTVSFQEEVQVFLVKHKSELDTSAKQALWWTGRDAAINKRAWLNHLGQPGCGRESAGRLRPQQRQQQQRRRQHERRHQQQQQQHHRHQPRDRSTHFLGSDRNTAAGRGRGASPSHIGGSGGGGFGGDEYGDDDDDDDDEASAAAAEDSLLPAADWVGILGCRCDACLTEGEDSHEQEEQGLPPRYNDRPPPPYNHHHHQAGFGGPYAAAAPTAYRRDHHYYPPPAPGAGTAVTYGSGAHRGVAARAASKTWPSPEDWDRSGGGGGDELGGKGSRSYSPGSASSSSPLYEACETYGGDDGSYFFDED